MKQKFSIVILLTIISILFTACAGLDGNDEQGVITASGTISATKYDISLEVSGLVADIFIEEGQNVQKGDVLFSVEDDILQAQAKQAQAAVDLADANISAALEQLKAAEIQAQRAAQGARLMDLQSQQTIPPLWNQAVPTEFEQPNWYYLKQETLDAALAELDAAWDAYTQEKENLDQVLQSAVNSEFLEIEMDLAVARARFITANQTLERANQAQENQILRDMAQEEYDAALADLETAQRDYDRALTSTAADEVQEARAKAAVASARVETAQNLVDSYQTREYSLDVEAAEAMVTQAEAAVTQAEAGKNQAAAALELLNIQLGKTNVKSPVEGVILSKNLQSGELVGPGSIVLTIAQLDTVELTVYIPEDVYGRIKLGQEVMVNVDSYPSKTFTGEVFYIADEAEFTPRNVQTVEGRKSTVYAVKILIQNTNQELKPGMPADVNFGEL